MSGFKPIVARSVSPVSINAPVEEVFPLACPVEEYRWIPGWRCNLVHCPNDRAELGTVFDEIFSAPFLLGSFQGKTRWTVTMHSPEDHRIHFRLDNKSSSSIYRIELEDDGDGGTGGGHWTSHTKGPMAKEIDWQGRRWKGGFISCFQFSMPCCNTTARLMKCCLFPHCRR